MLLLKFEVQLAQIEPRRFCIKPYSASQLRTIKNTDNSDYENTLMTHMTDIKETDKICLHKLSSKNCPMVSVMNRAHIWQAC